MARIKLSYVQEFRDRHGKVRRYFRYKGKRTPLPGLPGSAEFNAAYQDALRNIPKTEKAKPWRSADRSIGAAIDLLYKTHAWRKLKPLTRRTQENVFERIRSVFGATPAAELTARIIRTELENMTPGAARNYRHAFIKLMNIAAREEWLSNNPMDKIDAIAYAAQGHETWMPEHITAFEARHPKGTKAHTAMMLLLYTGQRRSDMVRMGWKDIVNGRIRVTQDKTSTELDIPIHRKLKPILAACPKDAPTFLVTEHCKPFTSAGFGNWFRERCDEAGLEKLSAHGLRKAAATRLAEAGCTPHQIQSITGHKTLTEVQRYTKKSDQRKLSDEAIKTLEEAETDDEKVCQSDESSSDSNDDDDAV